LFFAEKRRERGILKERKASLPAIKRKIQGMGEAVGQLSGGGACASLQGIGKGEVRSKWEEVSRGGQRLVNEKNKKGGKRLKTIMLDGGSL